MRVLVVGAGLSGLAAACHLVGAGHDVTVLERDSGPGGRAGTMTRDGFRFDTGPVVMTMLDLLHEPIRAAGGDPDALLRMTRLDPAYRAVYPDGSELWVRADMGDMRREIERVCGPGDAAGFDRFVAWLAELYDVEVDTYLDTNYDSPLDLLRSPGQGLRLLRAGGHRALEPSVARFFDDDRLTKVFSFQALYAGVAPAKARAVLAVIAYMDTVLGVHYPEGGIHAVPTAMARAFTDAGGRIEYDATVTEVLRRSDGRATGVAVGQERYDADAVVCTLDLPVAYDRLLPGLAPRRRPGTASYSPSAVVWHVGARGVPAPGTGHHNIHFGADWEGAFRALIDRRELMPDPSRLVTVPSVTDPTAAPAGHTALYVLEPVPHLQGAVDWRREAGPMRERLHAFLETSGYPTEVVTEELVTPLAWQAQGMHLGTPFALAHTFLQSGPFRPRNVDRRVPGLVFAGSGTTPGVGIPMVLLSGKLAAQRVAQQVEERRR